ncbi:MAG: YbcC family protein [Chromatocurvus sp.]
MQSEQHMNRSVIAAAADKAARQIPPLWPLSSSVAVNPFLGQVNEGLAEAGARLARVGGASVVMPRQWYLDRIASGELTDEDLAAALDACPDVRKPADIPALREASVAGRSEPRALPSVADLVADSTGLDWPGLLADRFGAWAAGYFDEGQALWAAPRGRSAWEAYRQHAIHDLTPEIMGLERFAAHVAAAPEDVFDAIAISVGRLGLKEPAFASYFHQLLLSLSGWSQYARYRLWIAELGDGQDDTIIGLLAIRLLWEEALFTQHRESILERWSTVQQAHAAPVVASEGDLVDAILQEAVERAAQRGLAQTLATPAPSADGDRPALQAAFCIDVRSEVFRRALEAVHPSIRTLGFAGFFGISVQHRRFASDVEELRLPGLLSPALSSCSGDRDTEIDDTATRYVARAKRAFARFKLAAVSSFAFVEAMGPVYVGKLVHDALARKPLAAPTDPAPRFDPPLDLETRISAAETVLGAMSLTGDFARVVLLAGHGANVTNNPFASGLHCGACGGYSGDVNARLLASLLNDRAVREGLAERGIEIPDDTLFVGALHDTTTDAVTLFDADYASAEHAADLAQVREWLEAAGTSTRAERSLRLPRARDAGDVSMRARDWAEVRPEWGLAGCKAFIAAPRSRTAGRSLEGRAFLHNYDWHADSDRGFTVLELIMTAPVVVASWISLQYYGSTVAPQHFGSGNKLLHNIVGGIGVFEGNGGLMRAGLPWQSVHDGENYVHEPLRLSVCIEAPLEAMTDILGRHEHVRALFDNRWLHLFAMNDQGQLAHRYGGDLEWDAVDQATREVAVRAVA